MAVAPVAAGSGCAFYLGAFSWPIAVLCLVLALCLQIGVNFANDYSDGVRGTDSRRVGPGRITGAGKAEAKTVLTVALAFFAAGAASGIAIVVLSQQWWLLAVGALALVAAWFYTGGKKPYGYLGYGEVMVFVFFGLVATVGTTYLLTDRAPLSAWVAATGVGALACALLVVNNLRDLDKDAAVGKRTLATRLGDRRTRWFYVALCAVALVSVVGFAALTTWFALVALMGVMLLLVPVRDMLAGASGRRLIPMLRSTSMAELGTALGLLVGVFVA